jgi:DNA-binding GntR family transcriptional regulator
VTASALPPGTTAQHALDQLRREIAAGELVPGQRVVQDDVAALYYNSPEERREAVAAHERILQAVRLGSADALVAELDAHRSRALEVLRGMLRPAPPAS